MFSGHIEIGEWHEIVYCALKTNWIFKRFFNVGNKNYLKQ